MNAGSIQPMEDPYKGWQRRAERAEGRIAALEADRDKAREECGHEKAMRASLHREFDGWLAACRKGECFPCVDGGRKAERDAAVALADKLLRYILRFGLDMDDALYSEARAFLDGVSP